MMKTEFKLYIVASITMLLSIPLLCLAQEPEINLSSNMPQAGDILTRQVLPYVYEGASGNNIIWDFSGVEPVEERAICYVQCGDSLLGFDEDGVCYYQADDDGFWQTGYENNLERMDYRQRLPQFRTPLAYGDLYTNTFEGEGRYCDTHYMRQSGSCQISADGLGMLVVSEEDTLKNVLRVRTVTTSALHISKDSIENDFDNMKQIVREQYQWYVKGFRYPVFETVNSTSYHNLKPVATQRYSARYLPDMQLVLNDSINKKLRHEANGQEQTSIFTYDIQNVSNVVTINYSLSADANIRAIIADAMGLLHKSMEKSLPAGEGYEMVIDCNGMRPGHYVIYMNVNGLIYNHKLTIR